MGGMGRIGVSQRKYSVPLTYDGNECCIKFFRQSEELQFNLSNRAIVPCFFGTPLELNEDDDGTKQLSCSQSL